MKSSQAYAAVLVLAITYGVQNREKNGVSAGVVRHCGQLLN